MNITQIQQGLVATHIGAINAGRRPSCLFMRGAPGIGKTEGGGMQQVELLAKQLRQPAGFVTKIMANFSSVDVGGFMLPTLDKETGNLDTRFSSPVWYPSKYNCWVFVPAGVKPHPDAANDTISDDDRWFVPGNWPWPIPELGVLLVDEWSQTDEDIQKPMAEVLLNGGANDKYLDWQWRVLAAGNRLSDRAGATRELSHIINRRCLANVDPHLPSWNRWAERQPAKTRPHHMTIAFANAHPSVVFRDAVPDDNKEYCTPRTLVKMDQDLRSLRTSEEEALDIMPTSDIARNWCQGWIGEAAMSAFFTHLRFYEKIPTIQDILRDPLKCKLPTEKAEQMVTGYMVAHHVNDETAEPIFNYMKRMQREMQTLTVNATVADRARGRSMLHAKGFSAWLAENKELLLAAKAL